MNYLTFLYQNNLIVKNENLFEASSAFRVNSFISDFIRKNPNPTEKDMISAISSIEKILTLDNTFRECYSTEEEVA